MKRSPSSIGGPPLPVLSVGDGCDDGNLNLDLDRSRHTSQSSLLSPRRSLFPNANSRAAISAGRALLGRPAAAVAVATATPAQTSSNTPFTASAAFSPLPPRRVGTEPTLKSCLSSSSNVLLSSTSSRMNDTPNNNNKPLQNEEFAPPNNNHDATSSPSCLKRNVSFSHLQVREYDITLGDNPSVSSGLPVSLGWSYDPRERIAPLDAFEAVRIRRPSSQLVLSDRQRNELLLRPDISCRDVAAVLQDVAAARLERKMSRNELVEERERQERARISAGRRALRSRRMSNVRSD